MTIFLENIFALNFLPSRDKKKKLETLSSFFRQGASKYVSGDLEKSM